MITGIEQERTDEIRIIVSFEDCFHAYQGTLVAAFKILRPDVEVMTVEPGEIGEAVQWFNPHVVIGSPFQEADVEDVPTWVRLSPDPTRTSTVKVNGDYSEMVNPTFDKLLVIVEKVTQRLHG